jgi:hypothetical protein
VSTRTRSAIRMMVKVPPKRNPEWMKARGPQASPSQRW